jgi:hypothetical protein
MRAKAQKLKKLILLEIILFTDDELMTGFELSEGKWYTFFSNKDKIL